MSGFRIDFPRDQSIDANSTVRSGAKFYVYSNETTTPVTLYSDWDAATTRANPIVADSAGLFPVVYVATDSRLTLTLRTSADVLLESWDDYEPVPSVDNADLANYVARAGGNANRMTGPFEEKEADALASATSLNLDAMTGNWGHVTGTTGIASLALAQGSRRALIFDGILTLTNSANLALGGVNIATHAGMILVFAGEGSGVTRLIGGMTASGRAIVESVAYQIGIGDETTSITAGTGKRRVRAPFPFFVTAARSSLSTAQTSGDLVTVDVNVSGVSIFTTVLTIDNNETTSTSALTASALTSSAVSVADDAEISVDIDDCDGSTTAKGLKVTLIGYKFNLS